jgi:hypothetical protein
LQVSVVVSRACTVSTERGATGAELGSACPPHVRQSLVRELFVSAEPRVDAAPRSGEHLVVVVSF